MSESSTGDWPSLDVIYDLIRARVADQNAQISALDNKANFSVASSTILITAATNLRTTSSTRRVTASGNDQFGTFSINPSLAVNLLTASALIVFLALVTFAFLAYRLRTYEVVPEPHALLEKYLDLPPADTKEVIAETLAIVIDRNRAKIAGKARWTQRVIACLMVQAVVLALMAVVQFSL